MKNKIFFLCFFPLILTYCKNSSIKGKSEIETINVSEIFDLDVKSQYLSEFASDFEYIRPETKPGSYFIMMGIKYVGPKFVILSEKRTQELYAYYRDGKFIGKLGEKGRGPAEYITPTQVFVLPEIEEIHIFDSRNEKILRYNFDLKFVGVIRVEPAPASIHLYQNKYYLCAYKDYGLEKNGGNDLIVRDPVSFKEVKVLWKRNDKDSFQNSEPVDLKACKIFNNQDTLFYAREISGIINIYKIFEDKLDLDYILDLKSSTNEYETQIPTFLNHIIFFGDYMIIGFQKNSEIYTGYYNLRTRKLSNYEIINDFDKGLNFFPMGNCADGGYYSDDLKIPRFNNFWESNVSSSSYTSIKSKFPDREKWLRETIQKSQEDNPWIMIVYP